MGYYDRSSAVADAAFDCLGRQIACLGIYVGKHWDRALIDDWRDRPHIGNGRCDDLLAGLGVYRGNRTVNSGCSTRTSVGLFGP